MTRHPTKRDTATARSKGTNELDRVVARPDGYYWVADGGRQEFGPYPTAAQALAAAREAIEVAVEKAAVLEQAEADIGVADRVNHDIVEVDEQMPAAGEER